MLRREGNRWSRDASFTIIGILLMLLALLLLFREYGASLSAVSRGNVCMDGLGLLILEFIAISIARSAQRNMETGLLLLIMLTDAVYLFSDGVCWLIDGIPSLYRWNFAANTVYLACAVFLGALFWFFLTAWYHDDPKRLRSTSMVINLLALIGLVLIVGNCFGRYMFSVDPETGWYFRRDGYFLSLIYPAILLFMSMVRILQKRSLLSDKLVLLSYLLMPYLSAILTALRLNTPLPCVLAFCATVFLYTNLYVRRGKELILREQALTQTKLNAMLLQINPHFIYNTLGSIDSLCATDPEEARKLIQQFSLYLQSNYTDMTRHPLIPFGEEVVHLERYLSIERVRFPNLKVRYDIQVKDFLLPSLSVQPLVENAVKHGICQRKQHRGTVTISSWEMPDCFCVRVEDDGVGFAGPVKDDRPHLGIENVTKRLELLCGGSLAIESTPGIGTVCTIRVPKEEKP